MAHKHQGDTHAWFKPHSNTDLLNQNVGKRKKNYGKITEISSASLAFPTLPVEQRQLLKCIFK
jgi:hypothetical protein